jgi:hypothetical protein
LTNPLSLGQIRARSLFVFWFGGATIATVDVIGMHKAQLDQLKAIETAELLFIRGYYGKRSILKLS